MQIEPESQNRYEDTSVINTKFLKSATFWVRLIIIAILTAGWISILQVDVTPKNSDGLPINIPVLIRDPICGAYVNIINYVRPAYLGICLPAWVTSIIYVALNIFNVQRFLKGFSFRVLFRVTDGFITFFLTLLWILAITTFAFSASIKRYNDYTFGIFTLTNFENIFCSSFGSKNVNSLGTAAFCAFFAWLFYLIDSCVRCCFCCGDNSGQEF